MDRYFFVDGKDLGRQTLDLNYRMSDAERNWRTLGLVFVSPQTGKVWATLPVLDGEKTGKFFAMLSPGPGDKSRCGFPPGSIWQPDLVNDLSPKALARELKIHLDFYEQKEGN